MAMSSSGSAGGRCGGQADAVLLGALIRDLTEHATQPRFTYVHRWRPFDLVMWDNRTTMHRARRFDRNEVRDVRRTTLAGDVITIEQDVAAE